jgi:hypothetical protein
VLEANGTAALRGSFALGPEVFEPNGPGAPPGKRAICPSHHLAAADLVLAVDV